MGNGETLTTSPSAPRGQSRQNAVLEAATRLFLEHGYEGTSLEMVIAEAGGSRRTIYEHFGNKEGLFAATIERLLADGLSPLSALSLDTKGPEKALCEAGQAFLKALTSPRILAAFRVVVGEVNRFPHLGSIFFEDGPKVAYDQVAAYLKRLSARGALDVTDPDLAARQLVEMMKGDLHVKALLCPEHLPTDEEIAHHVGEAVKTFLQGVRV